MNIEKNVDQEMTDSAILDTHYTWNMYTQTTSAEYGLVSNRARPWVMVRNPIPSLEAQKNHIIWKIKFYLSIGWAITVWSCSSSAYRHQSTEDWSLLHSNIPLPFPLWFLSCLDQILQPDPLRSTSASHHI